MQFCTKQEDWFANYSTANRDQLHRHPAYFVIEVVFLLVIMLVANLANSSVLIAILRVPHLRRNKHNIFVLNLIVMDLCTSLGSMPFSFIDLFSQGYLLCYPLICRIHGLLAAFGTFGNFSAVVLISVYRCIGIVTGNKINVSKFHIALMLAGGWLSAILTGIPTVVEGLFVSVYTPGTHHCSPCWYNACLQYKVALALIYCITIPSMIICYGLITIKTKRSADLVEMYLKRGRTSVTRDKMINLESEESYTHEEDTPLEISLESQSCEYSSGQESGDHSQEGVKGTLCAQQCFERFCSRPIRCIFRTFQHKMVQRENINTESEMSFEEKRLNDKDVKQFRRYDKRVAFSGILLVLTTTVCWTPYFIVHSCSRETKPSHALEVLTMWLGYLNSALDPIIYTVLNPKIRETVRQQHINMFRIIFPCRKHYHGQDSTSEKGDWAIG